MAQLHGSAEWSDMSKYVVHFTKSYGGLKPYDNAISILYRRRIEARNAFGVGRQKSPQPEHQRVVCFSEVPLGLLQRLADKRSKYGIVFTKDFVIGKGGNPILYAYKDSPPYVAMQAAMDVALADADAQVWKLAPFVDAPGVYGNAKYFFEWEREWRVLGDFSFVESDVAALILPAELHEPARQFFQTARRENTGPSYEHCPYIDPSWDEQTVAGLL